MRAANYLFKQINITVIKLVVNIAWVGSLEEKGCGRLRNWGNLWENAMFV